MRLLFALILILVCLCALSNATRVYVQDKLIRIQPLTDDHIQYLHGLENNDTVDFWIEAVSVHRPVDLHLRYDQYDHFVSEFKQRSLPFTVLVDDLQTIIDEERLAIQLDHRMRQLKSRRPGQERIDIVFSYASYADMMTYLQEQADANPTAVKVIDLGLTTEGRSTQALAIQFNSASTRNIWIDCGIHAREWITPTVCIHMIDTLIQEYQNNDPVIRDLLQYWTVYVAPSINPDGYEFSRTSGNRLWRKSRKVNAGTTCRGVDLNRNYPYQWNPNNGASSSPCSETFAGPAEQSEIETKNVVNFLVSKKGTWDMFMSFHSYGQWWFTPYGYSYDYPADYPQQLILASNGSTAITNVNGRRYAIGSVANLLYIASGSSVDWAYKSLGCRFSYTIELPPSQQESGTGFVLPPAQAPGVCRETYAGMKVFLAELKKKI